jgi:ribulose-5-phosphate 4-epimerase/fuculose-1-phosphate aldolase
MIDEGYIKYQCHWQNMPVISEADITELNQYREVLYRLGLIGEYDNGIGFGNLSMRIPNSTQLIISGTQTGGIAHLTARHYTNVIDFDWHKNYVVCQGEIKASSETLTHAAIYVAEPTVNAVIHVHHRELWNKLLNQVPTTDPDCAYGTPEMAVEIMKLAQNSEHQPEIIVMSGHEEGILSYGSDLKEASEMLLTHFSTI